MQTKTNNLLPKTASEIQNGGLYLQRVRCGKPNCQCAAGEFHTAYYFFTRRNQKLCKIYVRKADVEAFAALVRMAKTERVRQRILTTESNTLLKRLRESVRGYEQITKSSIGETV